MDEGTSGHAQTKSKKGRGPSRGANFPSEPMFLDFNELGQATGQWTKEFGQHIGHCVTIFDINIRRFADVEQSLKDALWNTTKVCYLYSISINYLGCVIVYVLIFI